MGYDPELVYETVGWGSEDGAEAVRRMILDGARCDGIFALNDRLAWGVLRGLRVSGIRCPGDVRVVGFDDVDESAYMVPSLTTVDPGKRDIARIAVQSVIDQITRGSRGPAGMLEAPCSLVFRESSPAV
jgi:DNA-binding LacI/PurR family transcriptional regulator